MARLLILLDLAGLKGKETAHIAVEEFLAMAERAEGREMGRLKAVLRTVIGHRTVFPVTLEPQQSLVCGEPQPSLAVAVDGIDAVHMEVETVVHGLKGILSAIIEEESAAAGDSPEPVLCVLIAGQGIIQRVIVVGGGILVEAQRLWPAHIAADAEDAGILRGNPEPVLAVFPDGLHGAVAEIPAVLAHLEPPALSIGRHHRHAIVLGNPYRTVWLAQEVFHAAFPEIRRIGLVHHLGLLSVLPGDDAARTAKPEFSAAFVQYGIDGLGMNAGIVCHPAEPGYLAVVGHLVSRPVVAGQAIGLESQPEPSSVGREDTLDAVHRQFPACRVEEAEAER